MPIDGKALYQMPQAQWIEEYGAQGHAIYNELQESKYGHVRFLIYFHFSLLLSLSLEYEI